MGMDMKTTVEISDELMIDAKKRAAESRTTLRALFERALRRELSGSPREKSAKAGARSKIRWVTAKGGLPKGIDVSNRVEMYKGLGRGV